ncbi:Rv3235 family protein [Streptomyces sp. NPDC048219]|uniref:Rv3235 family protein n=1 Tax=unclassified Streptomyces TaxID=2593676 RepID=UPI003426C8E7
MHAASTVPPLRKVMTRTRPASRTPAAPDPTDGGPVRVPAAAEGAPPAPVDAAPGAGTGTASGAPRGAAPSARGGVPPRRPGGSGVRTAAPGGRPPGSPGRSARARTRPADNRPVTTGPAGLARASARASATTAVPDRVSAAAGRVATTAGTPPTMTRTAPAAPPGPTGAAAPAAPVVPARTPRPPVQQLRPTDHFAELLLDVLSGRRPVHAMLRHTVGRAYDDLARLAERGPLRTRGTLPVVRDIGYYEAGPGALEVFARIGAGDQLRAMAFRLEQGRDLRWRCTAVELGGPRRPRTDDD